MKSWGQTFMDGFWRKAPPLFTALGLCPSLAVTTSGFNGAVMGLATSFVLVCTAFVVLAIRNVVPRTIRLPIYTVVIATFVTIVDLVLEGFLPAAHAVLGIFIPLIVVNCIILGRVEASFSRVKPSLAIGDALGYGLGFTWALTFIGLLREFFAERSLFGWEIPLGELSFEPWQIMTTAPGAFITMGVLVASIQTIRMVAARRGKAPRKSGAVVSQ